MATNPHIRAALLKKLGNISPQALSQRAQRVKKRLPMSPEDAVYVVAHQQGIDIGRYLDPATTARVSDHVAKLGGTAPFRPARAAQRGPKQVTLTIQGVRVGAIPGMTATHAAEARRMADEVYPLLYLFENSFRDVISCVLAAKVGADWWDRVVPEPVRKEATKRQSTEAKDPWHGQRGQAPIYYTDLAHLLAIVRAPKAWPNFKTIFPTQSWVEGVIDSLNVSRRVVAHMNPITPADVKQVQAGFDRWVRQLQAREADIP